MGCVYFVIALIAPRVLLFLIFLLTGWFQRAFNTWLWPIVGFLFMPYATLAYMAAMLNNAHQLTGGWLALFVVGVLVDLGHFGGGAAYRRRR